MLTIIVQHRNCGTKSMHPWVSLQWNVWSYYFRWWCRSLCFHVKTFVGTMQLRPLSSSTAMEAHLGPGGPGAQKYLPYLTLLQVLLLLLLLPLLVFENLVLYVLVASPFSFLVGAHGEYQLLHSFKIIRFAAFIHLSSKRWLDLYIPAAEWASVSKIWWWFFFFTQINNFSTQFWHQMSHIQSNTREYEGGKYQKTKW